MKVRAMSATVGVALMTVGCVSTTPPGNQPKPKQAAYYNVRLGVAYMQQGRLDVALGKLRRALKQDPDLSAAHTAIARLYQRRGNTNRAEKHYRRALRLAPRDPKVQNAYGVFLCRNGRAADSEEHFLKAARDPDYTTAEAAYTNAGLCLLKEDKQNRAEADFRRALQVDPEYGEALWQLARLTFDRGDYLKTRAFLQRFMKQKRRSSAQVLWLAARTELKLGANDEAQKFVSRLVKRFPDSSEATRARKMTDNGL